MDQATSLEELMKQHGEPATTAFLVYQTSEGQWAAAADYEEMELSLERKATLDDIIAGVSAVKVGASAQHTAMTTLFMMQQQTMIAQQKMQQQQEANKIASLIDPSKLRNPKA
jgi:hypothetical protein